MKVNSNATHNGRPHYSITCCKNSYGIHKMHIWK